MAFHRVPLSIEEPTGVRRERWPVRWGMPFPRSALSSAGQVRLLGPDGQVHPCEIQETAHWPDGSVKWILLEFDVDLGPQEKAVYYVEYGEEMEPLLPLSALQVRESAEAIAIDTGPLSFRVKRSGFSLLEQVALNDRILMDGQELWIVDGGGTRYDLSLGETREVVVEERTARRVVLRAKGTHRARDGRAFFDYLVRICARSGLPWLELEYTFVNTEDTDHAEVQEIALESRIRLEGRQRGTCGSGRKLYSSEEPFYFYHEELLENYGVFAGSSIYLEDGTKIEGTGMYEQQLARGWLDVSDATRGICVSMRDFVPLYPKEAGWRPGRIAFSIWPARSKPLRLHQGMARTHAFLLHFHEGDGQSARVHELAAAFEEPVLPWNGSWYSESGAFGLVFPFRPDHYPNLERRLRDLTVQARDSRSLGMIDYGDFVNTASTGSQGGFSVNNEPDRIHGFLLQYIRTGERIPWQLAEAGAWHAVDVDVVHHTTRSSIELGGHRIHGPGHVQYDAEGYPDVSAVPSHMWTEGLLEYYYLTGHPRFLEAALGIGESFLRMVEAGWCQPPYHSSWHSVRDSGWPLIGMAALYEATGDERYRRAMRRIFEALRRAQRENGGWPIELFFHTGFCPFQIAICLTGLARYHEACGDEEAREVFLRGIGFLAGDEMRFPDGSFAYVTTPEYRATYYSDIPLEPFGYAYRLTGDRRIVEQALRGWTRNLDLRASPRFLWAADAAGLLEDG